VIDIHSHILPAVDDGVRSLDEAAGLARSSVAEGVTSIAATPHVRTDWPTTPERMERGVAELAEHLARAGIPLDIVHGGEIALERLADLSADDLRRFSLGQNGKYLLVECPYFTSPLELVPAIRALKDAGLTAIVAHPERNPDIEERPSRLAALVELGSLAQVTAASVEGNFGRRTKTTALRLLELGLVHVLATDAHGPHIREGGLGPAAEGLGDPALARYLTVEAPGAILSGERVPPPPRRRRRRFRVF
jgi:protein-tyrosine phosphatase